MDLASEDVLGVGLEKRQKKRIPSSGSSAVTTLLFNSAGPPHHDTFAKRTETTLRMKKEWKAMISPLIEKKTASKR